MTGPFWTRPMAGLPARCFRRRSGGKQRDVDDRRHGRRWRTPAQCDARFFNQGESQTGQSDVRIFRFDQNDGTLLLGGGTVEVHGQDLRISDAVSWPEAARSLPT